MQTMGTLGKSVLFNVLSHSLCNKNICIYMAIAFFAVPAYAGDAQPDEFNNVEYTGPKYTLIPE